MRPGTLPRLRWFAQRQLGLDAWLAHPGDGRCRPRIAAGVLLWAQLMAHIFREASFHGVEALVRSPARRRLGVARRFGDDTLAYCSQRLDAERTRQCLAEVLKRAKRNKALQGGVWIGLAFDGTGAGRSLGSLARCRLCHPQRDAHGHVIAHGHKLALVSVVGCGLSLPFDVEPYGPGDSEYAASQRLLERVIARLGPRFADYAVGDGEYATAPFLHAVGGAGLHAVARLKGNLPELQAAVAARFDALPPSACFHNGRDYVEAWDADDFDPWETLRWKTVRVLRYRQHRPDGSVVEAEWLTDFPPAKAGSHALYRMAKSRWEIENQGFNDAKNRHGFEHIPHHHANSLLIHWLLILLALVVERLFRLRFLRRGAHPVLSSIQLLRRLRLQLALRPCDSS
ncbi:MAG: transposase [Terriglobales bacterium]